MRDQNELINDFFTLKFKIQHFPDSPITQTVYFSSSMGLEPGLSIKARIYTKSPATNVMNINRDTAFNLLEIKSTVDQQDAIIAGLKENDNQSLLIDSLSKKKSKDIVYRVQKASLEKRF